MPHKKSATALPAGRVKRRAVDSVFATPSELAQPEVDPELMDGGPLKALLV